MRLAAKLRRHGYRALAIWSQLPRRLFFRVLSSNRPVKDRARRVQATLLLGEGGISLGACQLGVWPSARYFDGSIYIEAREATATVTIEDGVWINNNAIIIAQRSAVSIGRDTLIGTDFTVYDSDFHDLDPARRLNGDVKTAPVSIGRNVFIGSHVTVMKGSTIGDNSVIASGAIVVGAIPANVIAGGVPAKVLGPVPSGS